MIADEVYMAMLEVGLSAKRTKIPGPLRTLSDTAQKSLALWRRDEQAAFRFARMVLSGLTNLRVTTGQLPEPTRTSCWRLLGLLEYMAAFDDGREEADHQASDGGRTR